MTVPSSLVVIVPSPSLSNKEKASLNSVEEEGGGQVSSQWDWRSSTAATLQREAKRERGSALPETSKAQALKLVEEEGISLETLA